jgi:hypothetical protein
MVQKNAALGAENGSIEELCNHKADESTHLIRARGIALWTKERLMHADKRRGHIFI